eukprot:5854983-Pyramimonas_sp.AAC.1
METWDISTAFLQGLGQHRKHARRMSIEVREQRKIYLQPPANVWRPVRGYEKSNIRIPEHE